VSGSGISWAICKSAPHSRQITTPTPHCSVFYRPDAFLITTIIMVTKKDDNNAFNYDAKILAVNKQNISHVTGY